MRTSPLLTRRTALATLTAGALASRTALAANNAPFRYGSLDHLAIAVDDTEKSVHFYTRLFGNTVLKEKTNPRHYVKLGPNYVAMEAAMLAPKAEVSLFPWKEPKERIPLAVRQIHSFLRAHRPASA